MLGVGGNTMNFASEFVVDAEIWQTSVVPFNEAWSALV